MGVAGGEDRPADGRRLRPPARSRRQARMTPDTAPERRALADRLQGAGVLTHPKWRAAVEAVPRELFLQPGFFLPTDDGRWRPVTALGSGPKEWSEVAYRDESLVTQLDRH